MGCSDATLQCAKDYSMPNSGKKRLVELRAIRDALVIQLRLLDELRERHASIELDSAIAILNELLGDHASRDDIEKLRHRLFLGDE
jgi:hypothetical protein